MTTSTSNNTPLRDPNKVYLTAGGLIYIAAGIISGLAIALQPQSPSSSNSITWVLGSVLLMVLVALADIFPMQVEVARNTVLITLSEIPLVLGFMALPLPVVVFTPTLTVVIVYWIRRDMLRHIVINSSFVFFETSVAAAGIVAVQAAAGPTPGNTMLGILLAVPLGTLLSAVIIGELHRLTDGRREPFKRNAIRSIATSASVTIVALLGWMLYSMNSLPGHLGWIGLIAVGLVIYTAYARQLGRQHDYARFLAITRQIPALAPELNRWPELLELVRDQFNAAVAIFIPSPTWEDASLVIAVPDGDSTDVRIPALDEDLLRPLAPVLARVENTGTYVSALQQRDAKQVLLVPLQMGQVFFGHLEVRDRRTRWGSYGPDDLQILGDVSRQIIAQWTLGHNS